MCTAGRQRATMNPCFGETLEQVYICYKRLYWSDKILQTYVVANYKHFERPSCFYF